MLYNQLEKIDAFLVSHKRSFKAQTTHKTISKHESRFYRSPLLHIIRVIAPLQTFMRLTVQSAYNVQESDNWLMRALLNHPRWCSKNKDETKSMGLGLCFRYYLLALGCMCSNGTGAGSTNKWGEQDSWNVHHVVQVWLLRPLWAVRPAQYLQPVCRNKPKAAAYHPLLTMPAHRARNMRCTSTLGGTIPVLFVTSCCTSLSKLNVIKL